MIYRIIENIKSRSINLFYVYYLIKFVKFITKKKIKEKKSKRNIILVEFFQYYPSVISLSYFCRALSEKFNAQIHAVKFNKSWLDKYLPTFSLFLNPFFYLFKAIGIKKIIFTHTVDQKRSSEIYKSVYKNINSKEDIMNIKINNLLIGEFIYDHYLRNFSRITIDYKSKEFRLFLAESINKFVFWDNYFSNHNIKSLVVTHTTYLTGMIVQIAIDKKIAVYCVGNNVSVYLNKKFNRKNAGYDSYKKVFNIFSKNNQKKYISISSKKLHDRLQGKKDIKLLQNTHSEVAFGKSQKKIQDLNKDSKVKILVAAHCFTDATHAFGDNLFVDFYEWVDYLGRVSDKTNYSWYIKLHPSHYDGNLKHFNKFKKKYKRLNILPKNINHNDLITHGIDCVLTVYGTIGHEYPLFGIPVVNASVNNPHNKYDFNYTPNNFKEYNNILLNLHKIGKLKMNKKMKNDIYKFFYLYSISDYEFINNLFLTQSRLGTLYNSTLFYKYFLKFNNEKKCKEIYNNVVKFIKTKKFKIVSDNSGKKPKIIGYI